MFAGYVRAQEAALIETALSIAAAAPFRTMSTPGGRKMSVGTTSCGGAGWISDRHGYRYSSTDPLSGAAWPEMPGNFLALANSAADAAGFKNFAPDSCLINLYVPGAKMTLHQDIDENDFSAPIVSVSLGLEAVFLWGGTTRTEKPARLPVASGDVLVWGGAARKNFHGILPLRPGTHPLLGAARLNLTFRKAR